MIFTWFSNSSLKPAPRFRDPGFSPSLHGVVGIMFLMPRSVFWHGSCCVIFLGTHLPGVLSLSVGRLASVWSLLSLIIMLYGIWPGDFSVVRFYMKWVSLNLKNEAGFRVGLLISQSTLLRSVSGALWESGLLSEASWLSVPPTFALDFPWPSSLCPHLAHWWFHSFCSAGAQASGPHSSEF